MSTYIICHDQIKYTWIDEQNNTHVYVSGIMKKILTAHDTIINCLKLYQ